jgi:hypothetical protein
MLAEHAEQWKLNWKSEGRQEGRQDGEPSMLLRELERRFGALPSSVKQRVQSADTTVLEKWGMRILDARSLVGVFGDRPA